MTSTWKWAYLRVPAWRVYAVVITGTRREKTADIMTVAENVVFSADKFETLRRPHTHLGVFSDLVYSSGRTSSTGGEKERAGRAR